MNGPTMIYFGTQPWTPCSVAGCPDVTITGGTDMCPEHARRQRGGLPLGVIRHWGTGKNRRPRPRPTVAERIRRFTDDSTTDPDGCWPWLGTRSKGYGMIMIGGKSGRQRLAHRVVWELHAGQPVPAGMLVRHLCGNPWCVRPTHLAAGTTQDNSDDMIRHGRSVRGERHPKSKLTAAGVQYIRTSTESHATLAKKFGVSETTIRDVRSGRRWGWLK
jgi:HNH endonuclease